MNCVNLNEVLQFVKDNKILSYLLSYYIDNCVTINNPYHNITHTFNMMGMILQKCKEENVDTTETIYLVGAAIFHDFNHSGGLHNDKVNVTNAKSGLCQAFDNHHIYNSYKYDKIRMCKYIDVTEFPYTTNSTSLTKEELIIRESDALQFCCSDFITQVIFGLRGEMKPKDFEQFLKNEKDFIEATIQGLRLDSSKKLVSECYDEVVNTIHNLDCIINPDKDYNSLY